MATKAERACAAVLRGSSILMVRHVHDGRDYWTLPGGAVELGESAEDAAIRELEEEARLTGEPDRQLYERNYRSQDGHDVAEKCFLVRVAPHQIPALGSDPEADENAQLLVGVTWRPLTELREDRQVSRVLQALAS